MDQSGDVTLFPVGLVDLGFAPLSALRGFPLLVFLDPVLSPEGDALVASFVRIVGGGHAAQHSPRM